MAIVLNGTTGITNDGGYTGDGVVFADTTPANTLVTTTGGNVGIGTSTPGAKLNVVSSGDRPLVVQSGTDTPLKAASTVANSYVEIANSTNSFYLGAVGANASFVVNGAERARITSDGSLFLNTTSSPTGNLSGTGGIGALVTSGDAINIKHTANGNTIINLWQTGTSSFGAINFFKGDAQTGVGGINCTTTSTSYATSSDYRLKHDIQPMTGALAKISVLKPCTYKWNADDSDGEGFIAHELAEVCPQAVTGVKDAVNEDGSTKPQAIDTSFLVATLTAAIQEQQQLITALTARVAALEGTQNV